MDPEYVEKEIKELRLKISDYKKKGQKKIQDIQRLQKDLNETTALILKYQAQIEALEKVLDN